MPDSYFIYNGKGCIDWGCRKTQPINFPTPVRDVERISVIGRNGDLVIDNGRFENVELVLECHIKGKFLPQFNALRAFMMADTQYHKLVDSLYPNEYRMARVVNVEPKKTSRIAGTVEITFDAKPQRYLTYGDDKTYTSTATPRTSYALSALGSWARGLINSLGVIAGYTQSELNAMQYQIININGVYSVGDMAGVRYGSDDAFFGLLLSDDPLTASGGTSRLLLGTTWKTKASNTPYLVMPKFFNTRLTLNGQLELADASFKAVTMHNPTQYDAKPLIKIATNDTTYDDYVGGINDCGVRINTNDSITHNAIITIDAETMDAYSLPDDNSSGLLYNFNRFVSFTKNDMVLSGGDNDVLTNKHIASMTVTPRWWTL